MADPAVLVFKGLVVPVARCLERERQHDSRDHNGQKPVCRSPPHIRTEKPPDRYYLDAALNAKVTINSYFA
jgi:hypothetical protein